MLFAIAAFSTVADATNRLDRLFVGSSSLNKLQATVGGETVDCSTLKADLEKLTGKVRISYGAKNDHASLYVKLGEEHYRVEQRSVNGEKTALPKGKGYGALNPQEKLAYVKTKYTGMMCSKATAQEYAKHTQVDFDNTLVDTVFSMFDSAKKTHWDNYHRCVAFAVYLTKNRPDGVDTGLVGIMEKVEGKETAVANLKHIVEKKQSFSKGGDDEEKKAEKEEK